MFLPLLVLTVLSLSGAMESGIVGGKKAAAHSRPYMVSLQHTKSHKCGGMLIRNDYVLTSAHCLDNIECSQLEVVLGAHNLKKKEFGRQRIQVMECIKHPKYIKKQFHYDIMLLKLKTKAKLNKFVKVKALPAEDEEIHVNQKCSIAGWGVKVPNGSAADVLQEVTLKVQSNFACMKVWQNHFNTQQMICTASDGKRAFCQGDSGGPLICNGKPQGIAAFAFLYDCRNPKYPEVYIKISYFIQWIKKKIG